MVHTIQYTYAEEKTNEPQKFYYYSMNQTTKDQSNRKVNWPLTKYQDGVPMERVHFDFLGSLPEYTAGNSNVLVQCQDVLVNLIT